MTAALNFYSLGKTLRRLSDEAREIARDEERLGKLEGYRRWTDEANRQRKHGAKCLRRARMLVERERARS